MASLAIHFTLVTIPTVVLQVAERDSSIAYACRILNTIGTVLSFIIEAGNFKKLGVEYFDDTQNIFDLLYIVASTAYLNALTNNGISDFERVLIVTVFVCIMAKIQNLIKFDPTLGALSHIIVKSIKEVRSFALIFINWTLFFEVMYYVLGVYGD